MCPKTAGCTFIICLKIIFKNSKRSDRHICLFTNHSFEVLPFIQFLGICLSTDYEIPKVEIKEKDWNFYDTTNLGLEQKTGIFCPLKKKKKRSRE